jgi:hypothetical protein
MDTSNRHRLAMSPIRLLLGITTALGLTACAVTVANRQPLHALGRSAVPDGSVYIGWRVFQDRCAACHGASATGGPQAPDLTQRIRDLGMRSFAGLVLRRYDWSLPADDTTVDAVVQRRAGQLAMPEWQGEPRVEAHIADLYVYIAARADGSQGPGRPTR